MGGKKNQTQKTSDHGWKDIKHVLADNVFHLYAVSLNLLVTIGTFFVLSVENWQLFFDFLARWPSRLILQGFRNARSRDCPVAIIPHRLCGVRHLTV